MHTAKERLLTTLGVRPVAIWGARMTGIGFRRLATQNGINAVAFIDSDPCLNGKEIGGLSIYAPAQLPLLRKQHPGLLVVIAVSIKEDEIVELLQRGGLTPADYLRYSEYCQSFYTIDVVGSCNLKCPSCVHSLDTTGIPKGLMSIEDFQAVTAKMMTDIGLVSHICLYSWGEPFLHPKLDQIIEHVHRIGVATAVSTNLSVISSDQIEKVVKAAPEYLKISLSGYYPDAYNSTHAGGDVNLVKSNLYKLRHFINKHKAPIFVEVNYHLYNNNAGPDLKKMQDLCAELGFSLATVYANVTPVERLIDYCEGKRDPVITELSKLLLVNIDQGLEVTRAYRHLPCRFLTNQININWDRTIPLCCVCFYRGDTILSQDYLKDSLDVILKNKENHRLCARCRKHGIPPYLLGVNQKGWEAIAKDYERTHHRH
jgi:MoaA/NifB/PqqE/SkfB family radical SAM enzyme